MRRVRLTLLHRPLDIGASFLPLCPSDPQAAVHQLLTLCSNSFRCQFFFIIHSPDARLSGILFVFWQPVPSLGHCKSEQPPSSSQETLSVSFTGLSAKFLKNAFGQAWLHFLEYYPSTHCVLAILAQTSQRLQQLPRPVSFSSLL